MRELKQKKCTELWAGVLKNKWFTEPPMSGTTWYFSGAGNNGTLEPRQKWWRKTATGSRAVTGTTL